MPRSQAAQRDDLVIDPGAKTISGRDRSGPEYAFDQGWISFSPRADRSRCPSASCAPTTAGRLIVIGGAGHSASASGAQAVTFANNDGWHDDTSDGPVRATVSIGDRELDRRAGHGGGDARPTTARGCTAW